jgi:HD-like signal output (HDOD) protein
MNEPSVLFADANARGLATVPSLCQEVLAALMSPDATTIEIGALIAQDKIMNSRVLQAINSAQFGLSRKITDAAEAVGLLGFAAVRSILAELDTLPPVQSVQPTRVSSYY